MKYFRKERISSVIQKELSEIINHEFEFEGALVTITSVEVGGDLEEAIVRVSVLPGEKSGDALKELQKSQRRLHRILLRKMNIRPTPQIQFEIDKGAENAAEVEKRLILL